MKLLDDAQIAADAEKRASYRLRGVTTNLEQDEAVDEDQENQHGELFDHLPRIDEARHDGVVN